MIKPIITKKKLIMIVMEVIVFLTYALFYITTYKQTELTFALDDMQLQDIECNYFRGGVFRHVL